MAKSEIIDQLVILAEAFGLTFSDARAIIYADCLADLPIDKIKAGIFHLIRNRTFAGNLPSVAEIREAAGGNGDDIDARALLAWNEARDAIHFVGHYRSAEFSDPIISQIIISWGGWEKWGDWPEQETRWKEKDFIQQYKIYARSPDQLPDQPDHLIGTAEGYNRDHFPEFVPEVMIGGSVSDKKEAHLMPYYGHKKPQFKRQILSPPEKKGFVNTIGPHSILPADHPVSVRLSAAGINVSRENNL